MVIRAVTFTKICKRLHERSKRFLVPETILISFYKKTRRVNRCYLMLTICFDKFPSWEDMLLPMCHSIQSFAFRENPGEVALKHYTASCVIANLKMLLYCVLDLPISDLSTY